MHLASGWSPLYSGGVFENSLGAPKQGAWIADLLRERDACYWRALASGRDPAEARAAAEQPASKTFRCGAQMTVTPKLMPSPEPIQRVLRTFIEMRSRLGEREK